MREHGSMAILSRPGNFMVEDPWWQVLSALSGKYKSSLFHPEQKSSPTPPHPTALFASQNHTTKTLLESRVLSLEFTDGFSGLGTWNCVFQPHLIHNVITCWEICNDTLIRMSRHFAQHPRDHGSRNDVYNAHYFILSTGRVYRCSPNIFSNNLRPSTTLTHPDLYTVLHYVFKFYKISSMKPLAVSCGICHRSIRQGF